MNVGGLSLLCHPGRRSRAGIQGCIAFIRYYKFIFNHHSRGSLLDSRLRGNDKKKNDSSAGSDKRDQLIGRK